MNETTPNVPLLRKTLEHIEAHPEQWNQEFWRCGTGMCFAGTACDLDGGEWMADGSAHLARREGEQFQPDEWAPGREVIHARFRARTVLGLTRHQAAALFCADNTLPDLRRIVGELCGEQA